MADELDRLVAVLSPRTGDRFFFLGDLVDKGPDSLGVLARVRDLLARFPGSLVVCGNHEESALRLNAKAQKAGSWAGINKATKEPWLTQATAGDFAFMATFPLFARPFPNKDSILVHGGLFPAFFDKHPLPDLSPNWHKGGGKQMDRARRFLRIRHIHRETGDMVTLGAESQDTLHWSEWWDGREGVAFFGHDPQRSGEPLVRQWAIGMDTGAVFGGRLTAAVLTDGPRPVDFVAVEAAGAFAQWLDASSEED